MSFNLGNFEEIMGSYMSDNYVTDKGNIDGKAGCIY